MRFKCHEFLTFFTLIILLNSSHVLCSPLIITCGTDTVGTGADGRLWEPDSKYLVGEGESAVAVADIQDPSLPSDVPFMSARIFDSESVYQFPLQNLTSRTLLRLHFYPASYANQNISGSYFSVSAGPITLLNNFSAFLTAEALSQSYIVKEYYLAPFTNQPKSINVTFRPAENSFAFVNGIEVIAAPAEIFDNAPSLVGSGSYLQMSTMIPINITSMETLFRLNVGGQFIMPANDSGGLMRTWYDDSVYIYGAGQGIALSAAKNVTIDYKGIPPYIAPFDVYQTYRSLGPVADVNKVADLSWVFEIDPGFLYLVRFHWCDSEMKRLNQRVFDVLINNKTAANEVDIISWTNVFAKPIKRDYVVHVKNETNYDYRLWITLRPTNKTKSEFVDVLLNGLEVFKLSDNAKSNLAGPNPMISDLMRKYLEGHKMGAKGFEYQRSNSIIIITCGAGGAAVIGIAAVIILAVRNRKKRAAGMDSKTSWLPITWNSNSNAVKSPGLGKNIHALVAISTDAASNCRYFSLAEITNATKNFDEENVIGVGGFGKVYKGVIDGETKVAVKRSNPSSEQGVNEFQTEIEMLSRLRHRHLVSLIGFCEDNGEMILVYDYMGLGTLREHLYKDNRVSLSWKQRLQISIGAARGLHYLHTGAKYTIIHRDVKTTNILLDDKWVAKVSDFGLSKTGPTLSKGPVSTVVKGSFGYLDPEYFRRQQLTEKSDVYSFGVVLFEVLCARPALCPNLPQEQVSLADWAVQNARNGTLEDIIDPQLKGVISPDCLAKFIQTATKCLAEHGGDRPPMGDVLWSLEMALQLQEKYDNANGGPLNPNLGEITSAENNDNQIDMHKITLGLGDEDEEGNGSKNDQTFSLYVNQEGR